MNERVNSNNQLYLQVHTVVHTAPEQIVLSKQSVYGDEAVVPAQVPIIPVHHLRYAEVN